MAKRILFCVFVAVSIQHSASADSSSDSGNKNSVFYIGLNAVPVVSLANNSVHTDLGGSMPGDGGAVSTSTTIGYDTRFTFGPILYRHFLFGFSYNYKADETHRPSAKGGDPTKNEHVIQKEWGPTWGILYGHWQFKATWLISSQILDAVSDSSPNNTVTLNYDGHGWEFSLGYAFDIFDHFSLGPSLVYRRVRYGLQTFTDNVNPGSSYAGQGFVSEPDNGQLTPMLLLSAKF
jgi:hypothetical protein